MANQIDEMSSDNQFASHLAISYNGWNSIQLSTDLLRTARATKICKTQ